MLAFYLTSSTSWSLRVTWFLVSLQTDCRLVELSSALVSVVMKSKKDHSVHDSIEEAGPSVWNTFQTSWHACAALHIRSVHFSGARGCAWLPYRLYAQTWILCCLRVCVCTLVNLGAWQNRRHSETWRHTAMENINWPYRNPLMVI